MANFSRKYATAFTIDGVPLITVGSSDYKASPTLAVGDVTISKDGGGFVDLATLPVVTPAAGRAVQIVGSATEAPAARLVIQFVDVSSPKEWEDQFVIVETFGHPSAQEALDRSVNQTGDSFPRIGATGSGLTSLAQASVATEVRLAELDAANLPTDVAAVKMDTAAILVDTGTTLDGRIPAALVAGRMDASVGAMVANTLTASALAADAVTKIQSGIPTAANIEDAVWNAVATSHASAGSAGKKLLDVGQDTVTTLKAELFDGVALNDIVIDLLASASGKMVQISAGVFDYKARNGTTTRFRLSHVGTERLRS